MRTNVTKQFRSRERNRTFTVWSFCSRERKCMGTKRPGTHRCILRSSSTQSNNGTVKNYQLHFFELSPHNSPVLNSTDSEI